MKRTLGSIIVVFGIAVALTACGSAAPAGGVPANSASSAAGAQAPAGNRQAQGIPGVTGDVVSVNGPTITIQAPQQSGTTTVQLTGSTQVIKQVTAALASVSVGESISAVGSQDGDVFAATLVRLGTQAGPVDNRPAGRQVSGTPRTGGNGGGQRQGGNGGQRQAGAAGQPGGGQGDPTGARLFGTVEQASADAIRVKAPDGTTTQLRLAPNGQVTEEVAGTAADISPGARVVVTGDQQNGTVTATRVQIVSAAARQ